ncbi:hypothetical protein NC652_019039 [Populus alba x Populus x berolinensis]|nr:hypothetical protein NC652_019029 [Populus alba x Populus x berolinensis]KAJ6916508.1 hypothetical protein NC652_019032 [Populus alba x Populus x berolinensis]KAJ6916515.1 hypothetical protein NC652_019039 [Populus alba x Populus x berolinensis]
MKLEAASYATFVMALCREGRVVKAYESTLEWLKKAIEQSLAIKMNIYLYKSLHIEGNLRINRET